MSTRRNYVSVLMLMMSVGIGVWLTGCTQSVDVPTSVTSTTLTLNTERLPTPPKGMIYELWVGDTTVGGTAISLGKFFYNYDSVKFYDETMVTPTPAHERSDQFVLNDDLLRYSMSGSVKIWKYPYLFVTINRIQSTDRGPIMLIDHVSNPEDNPIDLVFPMSDSLWTVVARVNFQATSGRSRLQNIGRGVWLSTYRIARTTINDTLIPDDLFNPEARDTSPVPAPREYLDSIKNPHLDTVIVRFGKDTLFLHDTTSIFGDSVWSQDTLTHLSFVYDKVWKTDSAGYLPGGPRSDTVKYPRRFKHKEWKFHNRVDSNRITYDIFVQGDYGFPSLRSADPVSHPTGWRYKFWVVSPYVPTSAIGAFTPPAWKYKSDSIGSVYNFIPGDLGGLMTMGTFYNVATPDDDGNKYGFPKPEASLYPDCPPYPGGDFLDPNKLLADFGVSSIDFMPNATGNVGTVFISLEPENYTATNTNFPLIIFKMPVPSTQAEARAVSSLDPKMWKFPTVQPAMDNMTKHVRGDLMGFPSIDVAIERR